MLLTLFVDNRINDELRIRAAGIAIGMFSLTDLSNLRKRIHETIFEVNNVKFDNTDNRNVIYWNLVLSEAYRRLKALLPAARSFKKDVIQKKPLSSVGSVAAVG